MQQALCDRQGADRRRDDEHGRPEGIVGIGAARPGPNGQTYLGPPGDAGTADDRIVSNVDANSFTTVWVDPDNASRYGTSVYVRCGKR